MTVRNHLGPQDFMATPNLLTLHWFFWMLCVIFCTCNRVWQLPPHLSEVRACTHSGERGLSSFDLVTWSLAVLLLNSFCAVGDCVSLSFFHKKIEHPLSSYPICKKARLRNTRAGSLEEEEITLPLSQPRIGVGCENRSGVAKTHIKWGLWKTTYRSGFCLF